MDSGQDKEKRPVPKFASFKPKAPVPSPPPRRSIQRETKPEEERTRRRDRRKRTPDYTGNDEDSLSRRRRRRKDTDRHIHARHSERITAEVEPLAQRPRQTPGQDDFYRLDPKGDPYNLTYGSLHKYDVPRYHRFGSGRVLGLGSKYRIDYELADGKSLVLRTFVPKEDGGKGENKDLWRRAAKGPRPRKLRRTSPVNSANELERDFLSLTPTITSKRRRLEDRSYVTGSVSSDEETLPSYRYTERKIPSASEMDTISDSVLEFDDESARLENARLSQHVEEQPGDLRGWFKLIDHQENLIGVADNEGRRKLTSAEKSSVADIKISIYENALKRIPLDIPRDRLLLGMMEESSTVWDKKTLANKWKAILESNPGCISLWIRYLDFQQTSFINFTYEKCRSVFQECLKVNQRNPDDVGRNVINLYILLRFSLFMREAGYLEQSLAIWQAVLEFNFFHPKNLDLRRDSQTASSSFSEFWESEVPRIGEEGAKGWHLAIGAAPDTKSDPTPPRIDGAAIFQSWVRMERDFMKYSSLPARTLDEVQEDDPYRVIIYTDIADFLIPFSSFGLSDMLIDAFLIYCHLPPHVSSLEDQDAITNWRGDPFFCNRYLESDSVSSQWFSSLTENTIESAGHQPFLFPQQNIGSCTDTLFGNGRSWFGAFENWKSTYVDQASYLNVGLVLRCLKQLVAQNSTNDILAEYTVALESVISPKGAKSYAKGLLRDRPACIRLYNAYALLEVRNGQTTSAEKVLMTALSMSKSFPEAARMDCILLWRTWIWECLDGKQYDKARMLLLAIPDTSIDPKASLEGIVSASPAEFLRSQRFLGDSQAHALSFRRSPVFSHCTDCLALLTYLTREQDIGGAMDVYKSAEQQLTSQDIDNKTFLEPIHQGKARLLYHHLTTSRIYKPSLIREELKRSISLFPQNTMFLSLLAFNESRFRIDDRVRSTLNQQLSDSTSDKDSIKHWTDSLGESTLIPHLFAIYTEIHRGLAAGSTAHSARAVFESAVATRSGQCSAVLWKLYIQFEIALGEKARAREVFFRSIRACPWAKELVLLSFSEAALRDEMGIDELRRVWNVLAEKELRIHIDLEEWFGENEEMQDDGGDTRQPPIIMPDDKSSDGEEF